MYGENRAALFMYPLRDLSFSRTRRFPDHYRVNLACIDDVDIFDLPFDVLDGKHLL